MLLAASQTASAITINLDYSYDSSSFFADSSRRSLMQSAASYFESRLTDDFEAITSSGSNSMTAQFWNPSGTGSISVNNFSVAADTITVYVGAKNHSGSTLATGGYGGWEATGTSSFFDTIYHRGESSYMYNDPTAGEIAAEFNPWGGTISFDTDSTWYFDDDLSTTESFTGSDFYSVALHELGHILGLGSADSWDNLINGSNEFTGVNSVAENSGNVPLTSDGAHWAEDTMSFVDGVAQEAAMDPNLTVGTRKLFTVLDWAALDDIGWDVMPTSVPLPPALFLFAGGLLGFFGLSKHRHMKSA